MNFIFQESRLDVSTYPQGCPPGFEVVTADIIQTSPISLETWLRSIFVYSSDFNKQGLIQKVFFERRGQILLGQDQSLPNFDDNTLCFFDKRYFKIDEAFHPIAEYLQTQLTVREILELAQANLEKSFCFKILSTLLLNYCFLSVCGVKFRLLEVEFYYHSKEHPDPYPHKDVQQAQTGYWYFHRCPTKSGSLSHHRTGNSYRNGTFKGLDISLGSKKKKSYGGVLIRSLFDLKTKEVVCGPSLCVDAILSASSCSDISTFVKTYLEEDDSIENENFLLYSRIHAKQRKAEIYSSMRIGLNLNKPQLSLEDSAQYLTAAYRYFVTDLKLSKGRTHACLELIRQGQTSAEISRIFGSTNLANLFANFKAGKKQKLKEFADRKLTDKDLAFLLGSVLSQS